MRNMQQALRISFTLLTGMAIPLGGLLGQESPSAITDASPKVSPCPASQGLPVSQAVQYPDHMVSPKYPKQALASGLEGSVELTALIGPDARMKDLGVVNGDSVLVSPSVRAVRQWRFRPVLVNGEPVETRYRIKIRFSLLLQEAISEIDVESPRETAPAPKIANEAEPPKGGVYKVGSAGVIGPKPTYAPDPEFSEKARKTKEQETVTLSLIVGTDGKPQNVRVACGAVPDLDEKAIETVKTWRFEPGTKDGKPVAVEIAVQVDFHLFDQ